MITCIKCGTSVDESAKFCPSCGTRIKKKPKKNAKGIIFLLFGILIGAVTACTLMILLNNPKKTKMEGAGYKTPEDAVMAYAEYLKNGDMEGMISTFAVESYVEHFDMRAHLEYYDSYFPYRYTSQQANSMVLSDSDHAAGLNAENRRAYITGTIFKQYMGVIISDSSGDEIADTIADGTIINFQDEKDIDDVMNFLKNDPKFYDMKIGDFIPCSDLYEGAGEAIGINEHNARLQKHWAADEVANVNLKLEIGGEDYILFMMVVRYGDKWYNAEFGNIYYLMMNHSPMYGGLANSKEE